MPKQMILLVEDDVVQMRQMARVLKAEGYHVSQASCGDEAVRILEDGEISLVLTDRKMPGMDGDSLLQHLRTHYADIPVAVVTAYPEGIEILGPDALLVKPFNGDQLKETVHDLIKKPTA